MCSTEPTAAIKFGQDSQFTRSRDEIELYCRFPTSRFLLFDALSVLSPDTVAKRLEPCAFTALSLTVLDFLGVLSE